VGVWYGTTGMKKRIPDAGARRPHGTG
jgi:hypothetical protein